MLPIVCKNAVINKKVNMQQLGLKLFKLYMPRKPYSLKIFSISNGIWPCRGLISSRKRKQKPTNLLQIPWRIKSTDNIYIYKLVYVNKFLKEQPSAKPRQIRISLIFAP
ncbi:hypothetical protein V6Z11_D07G185700 [Gossypium hirsutum]